MNFNLSANAKMTRVLATAAAGLGIFALAACGPAANSGSAAKPAAQTQNHKAKGADASGNPQCQTSDLKLGVYTYDVGQDYNLQRLSFTNTSGFSCELYGYPGVSYQQYEDGGQVGKPAYRKDVGGDYQGVLLQPGDKAYSFVKQPSASSVPEDECGATDVSGLKIFPPNNTDASYVELGGSACDSGSARMSVGPVTSDPDAIP